MQNPAVYLYYFERGAYDTPRIHHSEQNYIKASETPERYETFYGIEENVPDFVKYFAFLPQQFYDLHEYNFVAVSYSNDVLDEQSLYLNIYTRNLIPLMLKKYNATPAVWRWCDRWASSPQYNGVLLRVTATEHIKYIHLNFNIENYIDLSSTLYQLGADVPMYIKATDELIRDCNISLNNSITGVIRLIPEDATPNRIDIQL